VLRHRAAKIGASAEIEQSESGAAVLQARHSFMHPLRCVLQQSDAKDARLWP
jgi:hypothetical protein